jgi:hypothetical protein
MDAAMKAYESIYHRWQDVLRFREMSKGKQTSDHVACMAWQKKQIAAMVEKMGGTWGPRDLCINWFVDMTSFHHDPKRSESLYDPKWFQEKYAMLTLVREMNYADLE